MEAGRRRYSSHLCVDSRSQRQNMTSLALIAPSLLEKCLFGNARAFETSAGTELGVCDEAISVDEQCFH